MSSFFPSQKILMSFNLNFAISAKLLPWQICILEQLSEVFCFPV